MWRTEEGISNSAGNLILHIIGNLRAFISIPLANISYMRERELEFCQKNISKIWLLENIDIAAEEIKTAFNNIDDSLSDEDYLFLIGPNQFTYHLALVHLYGHLSYHLGQINYYRRLLDK
ncbi:MAG: DUF1572 family protein [Chryseobacterium sp.]|nr:DUF1572 family protein [Chryseobacterium sp.]